MIGIDPNFFSPISPDVNGIECDAQHRSKAVLRSKRVYREMDSRD
jgi:hypothetical protein